MTFSVRMTLEESKLYSGESYYIYYAAQNMATLDTKHMVFRNGDDNIVVRTITIKGSSNLVTWSFFRGTVFTENTQEETLIQNRRNPLAGEESTVETFVNPTITGDGDKIIDGDIDSVAVPSATGEAVMNTELLGAPIILPSGQVILLKVHNRDTSTRNVEVVISYHKM